MWGLMAVFRRPLALLLSAAALAAALLLSAPPVDADHTALNDLRVRVDGNLARVSFVLDGAFTPGFVERLESGLPASLVYQVVLYRDHKKWFDNSLAKSRLHVAAMYDAATRGYLINYKLDGELVESRMVRDLDDVEAAMTRIEDLPAFHLDPYPRDWRLLVRARAVLGSRTLLWVIPARVKTDWRESRKFRSLNALPDAD